MPAGVVEGDLLLMHVSVRGGSNVSASPPLGWTQLRNSPNGTAIRLATYYKLAAADEPASHTVTFGGANPSQQAVGQISAYSDPDQVQPVEINGAVATGTSTTPSGNSVTVTEQDGIVVFLCAHGKGASFTPPTGMTERADGKSGASAAADASSLESADMKMATPAATGTKRATATVSAAWVGHLVALRPA